MLAYILAVLVGTGSVGLYIAAFFFPEIHRKHDFIWSGVGCFYALTLWIYRREVVGGILIGQIASVALLGWSVWQTLKLRRQLVPFGQQASIAMPTQIKERLSFNRSADPRATIPAATVQTSVNTPKVTTSAPPPLQQPQAPVATAPIAPVSSSATITPLPAPANSVRPPAPVDSSPKPTQIARSIQPVQPIQSIKSLPVEQKVVPPQPTVATPDRVIPSSVSPDLANPVEERAWIELSVKPAAEKPLGTAVKPPSSQAPISPAIEPNQSI